MAGYGQFCPIAATAEVLTERWTPLVIRELVDGSRRFNDIQRGVPLMSSSLLTKRLRTLEAVGVIEHRGNEYVLTQAGEELQPLVEQMAVWGERWIRRTIRREDADAAYLMWAIRSSVVTAGGAAGPDDRALPLHRHPEGEALLVDSCSSARGHGRSRSTGPSHLVHGFPEWFGLSSLIGLRQS